MSASVQLPLVEDNNVEENSPTEPIESVEKLNEAAELIEIAEAQPHQEETLASSSSPESTTEVAKADDEEEEEENVPSTSQAAIEEVDSKRSTGRAKPSVKTPPLRPLLKRRSSRIRIPIVSRSRRNVEETDSATPRTSNKRNTKKRRIALFLESDYPRKK